MEYVITETERRHSKKYYQKNHEKLLEQAKRYRDKNKESIRAYQKRYAMTHDRSEYHKQYYERNKEAYHQRYLRNKAKKEMQESGESV